MSFEEINRWRNGHRNKTRRLQLRSQLWQWSLCLGVQRPPGTTASVLAFLGHITLGFCYPYALLIKSWCQPMASFRFKDNQTAVSSSKKVVAPEPTLQPFPHPIPSLETHSRNQILSASCSCRHESKSSWSPIQWIINYKQQKRRATGREFLYPRESVRLSALCGVSYVWYRNANGAEKQPSMYTQKGPLAPMNFVELNNDQGT